MILPAKMARRIDPGIDPTLIGVAPSLLGPAGLLLVILSSKSRFAHLALAPAAAMAGTVALGLEFAQMLPLVRKIYTFDWLDVAATLIGVLAGAAISSFLRRAYHVTR
jgi:glycopeptide antibiotics resistance protein